MTRAEAYLHAMFHLDPANGLVIDRQDIQTDRQRSDSRANRVTNGYPKTAELIEMPFGLWTRVGSMKHVLHAWGHIGEYD